MLALRMWFRMESLWPSMRMSMGTLLFEGRIPSLRILLNRVLMAGQVSVMRKLESHAKFEARLPAER